MDDYDVFLNHRGPDVKAGFVAHLEEALRQGGLNPFLDKASLKKGNHAFGGIDKALEVARVHVAVVSRRYAESKHCLSELVAMLRSGKPVVPVFYDVEPMELRRVDRGVFAAAFKKHRRREAKESVEEWVDALCKLADITAFVFRLSDFKGNEVELKREVVDVVLGLLPKHDALHVEPHLVGLEKHVQICVNNLQAMSNVTSFLCLVGMGGIGKTSLAKVIYNHLVSKKNFKATSFLEIGHHTPTSMEVGSSLLSILQKQLLWDLLQLPPSNQKQRYGCWLSRLRSLGPILIVLDDIHDKDQFDELIHDMDLLARGSCIMVTSRDRHLLKLIVGRCNFYLHEVTPLEVCDSSKLFNRHAFGDEEALEGFEALANDVSKACGGLPLALKVVGSSLYGLTSIEDQKCIWPEAIDALKGDSNVRNALKWSYDQLEEQEQLMFVDIACVFYGWKKQEALEMWQSCKKCSPCCGSGTPHTSLRHLIDKSLIVLERGGDDDILSMHGLLRDMGEKIGEVEGSHLWEDKVMKVVKDGNQNTNKARFMNLAMNGRLDIDLKELPTMPNLHFLILDGRKVDGNIGNISKELRYLRWKNMPLTYIPSLQNLMNLISLDFSESTKLANIWIESEPTLEGCPKLLRLKMRDCSSITTLPNSIGRLSRLQVLNLHGCIKLQELPDSIGRLSRLQVLNLHGCIKLQELPDSIGHLTALEVLNLSFCESLEALPDSIIALSHLERLYMVDCLSISKLPATFGLMTGLKRLTVNLTSESIVVEVGQLDGLEELYLVDCSDEAISAFSSSILTNLHQLSCLVFYNCPSMIKLPEAIGILANLEHLMLGHCEKVRELPNSIGQLKALKGLILIDCSSLETLPDSLGALTGLGVLLIVDCTSVKRLPTSVGHLSSLQYLYIQGCSVLQTLPNSLSQLNKLQLLQIFDCGSSLKELGLVRALQGLRIWGCTSITELSGSCLMVVDSNLWCHGFIWDWENGKIVHNEVKEVRRVETYNCGFLCHVQENRENGRVILQHVHKSLCCKTVTRVYTRKRPYTSLK